MRVETVGLADIGDGVFERVAGEQDAVMAEPDHGASWLWILASMRSIWSLPMWIWA